MLRENINTKVSEKTIGEKKLSERETYLLNALEALLKALLYTGMTTDSKYISGVTKPTTFGEKTPVG